MTSRTRTLVRALGVTLGLSAGAAGLSACGAEGGGELQVLNLDPRAGATAGDQPVTIVGSNFRQDIGYTVYFGSKRAEHATILDSERLVVATPRVESAGAVDVTVVADNGPGFRIVQGFRFEDMGGNVMEQVGGQTTTGQGEERF